MIKIFSDEEFERILEENKYVVGYFNSTSCPSCKHVVTVFLNKYISNLKEKKRKKTVFCDITSDSLKGNYSIEYVPTIIIFKRAEIKHTVIGSNTGKMQDKLDSVLE